MTGKRIFPVLFGVIAVLIVIVVAVRYPVLAEDIIYLPIISGPRVNVNSANVDEKPVLFEIVETPIAPPTLLPNSDVPRQIEEHLQAERDRVPVLVETQGETTKGTIVNVGKSEVQLPPHMMVVGGAANVSCPMGSPCPVAPYYTIGTSEDYYIMVGGIEPWILPIEEIMNQDREKYIADFRFVYEALDRTVPLSAALDLAIVETHAEWIEILHHRIEESQHQSEDSHDHNH